MKVLLALDESPVSLRAAQEAVRLLSGDHTEFLVLNVARAQVPWVPSDPFGSVGALPRDWPELSEELQEKEVLDRTHTAAEQAREAGVKHPEVLAEVGDPADRICEAADEHDVDVVVVGSHDKSFLGRLIDPSV